MKNIHVLTWAWFTIDAVRHSLVTCHDVMLQDNIRPLVDLMLQKKNRQVKMQQLCFLKGIISSEHIEKTDLDGSVPGKVEGLLSALV